MSSLTSTMLVLFGVIVVGYIAGKKNILDGNANKIISNLMMNILAPFLIISSVTNIDATDIDINVPSIIFIGIIMYLALIIFARVYARIMPLNEFELPVHEVTMVFGNVFFLGYPVFNAIFGKGAIFFNTMLNLPFNILLFSYGMYLFTKDIKGTRINLKKLISPALIASILALAIYSIDLKVPNVINEIFTSIGDITIPLSMLLIGSSLATIEIKYLFKDYKVLIYSIIKLLILPTIAFFITRAIGLDEYLIKMITISVGFPAASMVVMFATQYDKSIRSASIIVFMSTLLSVFTIPLIEKFLFALI